MKKALLLTLVGTIFAAAGAFAHCGSCGVGDDAEKAQKHEHKHEHKMKGDCPADCDKACCADKDMKKKKMDCPEGCEKPCCADKKDKDMDKSSDETAVAPAGACCAAGKAAKPA